MNLITKNTLKMRFFQVKPDKKVTYLLKFLPNRVILCVNIILNIKRIISMAKLDLIRNFCIIAHIDHG